MTDFQHTQFDPHRSHQKMLHVQLTHLPPRCAMTFFPAPEGQAVKHLRTPPSKSMCNIFRWLPCGWDYVCLKFPLFFWRWCDGVMNSALDFDLLGESVPQVRVPACTLALRGFFNMQFILTPFFLDNIFVLWAPWREVFSSVWLLALWERGKMSVHISERGASRVRVTSPDDFRVDWIECALSPSLSRLFLRMVWWRDG